MKKLSVILLLSITISLLCSCSSDNSKTAEKDTKATTTTTETATETTTETTTEITTTAITTTEKETQGTEKDEKNDICAPLSDEKYGAEYEKVWESEDGVIRFVIDSNKCKSRSGIHEGTYSYEFESSYVSVYLNDFRDRGGPYDEGYACVFKDIYEEGFPDDPDSQYLGEHTYLAGYYKISKDDKSFTVTVSDMEEALKYKRPKDSIESKYKNGDKVVFYQVSE